MRVAISGTHGCGKSTLIDAFLLDHRDYLHEPEPYEALQDLYGEAFGAEPSSEDFYIDFGSVKTQFSERK